MLQNYYPEKDQIEIQKQFGSGFTESLLKLSSGQWHGSVLSGYGVHLVYVNNISEPLNEKFYASLRDQYTIVIEEPIEDDKVAALQESVK